MFNKFHDSKLNDHYANWPPNVLVEYIAMLENNYNEKHTLELG